MSAVNNCFNLSYIRTPCSARFSVGVRNIVSENKRLLTEITLCHLFIPPLKSDFIRIIYAQILLYHTFSENAIDNLKFPYFFLAFFFFPDLCTVPAALPTLHEFGSWLSAALPVSFKLASMFSSRSPSKPPSVS